MATQPRVPQRASGPRQHRPVDRRLDPRGAVGENAERTLRQPGAERGEPCAKDRGVALSPVDGSIGALVGGFDYFDPNAGKFNRAIQARRQPGSGYKPFL